MATYKYTHRSSLAFLTVLADNIKEANDAKRHIIAEPEAWIYRGKVTA